MDPEPLLHRALERRRDSSMADVALLEALLRCGADPNVEQAEADDARRGYTALYFASRGDSPNHHRAFRALLDAGAVGDAVAISAGTATTCALRSGGALSCWGDWFGTSPAVITLP